MYKDIGRLTPKINKWNLEKKINSDAFYDEVKPLFFILKIYGRLLYSESKGIIYVKYISKAGLYWLINFVIQSILTIQILIDIVDQLNRTNDFSRRIQLTMSMLLTPFHFCIPFSIGFECPKLCFFVQKWGEFQRQYELIFGHSYKTNFGDNLKYLYIFVPTFGILMALMITNAINTGIWYHVIIHFYSFSGGHLILTLWVVALLEMEKASKLIKKRILTVINLYNQVNEIHSLRHLWIDLSDLVSLLGNTGFISMILVITTSQVILIMASYSFFSRLFIGDSSIHFLPICVMAALILFVILYMGQRSIDKIGCEISQVLNMINTTRLSKDALQEVQLFISSVASNYPYLNLGGFLTMNSATFSTMVNVVVTYLIVLVQFRIASFDAEKLQKLNNNPLLI